MTKSVDLSVPQMFNQWVEAFVTGNYVKVRIGILGCDFSHIERDMKIQSVRTIPCYLLISSVFAQILKCGGEVKWHTLLVGPYEYHQRERMASK